MEACRLAMSVHLLAIVALELRPQWRKTYWIATQLANNVIRRILGGISEKHTGLSILAFVCAGRVAVVWIHAGIYIPTRGVERRFIIYVAFCSIEHSWGAPGNRIRLSGNLGLSK